ncbi:MAG TPA: hypothetical protein VGM94_05165 [Galbitalea sp.]|jgi:hypothetical protein
MIIPVLDKLAYSIPNFAEAVDLSVTTIRDHIDAGNLVPSYPNSKPIITRAEGERWLRSLPAEKQTA